MANRYFSPASLKVTSSVAREEMLNCNGIIESNYNGKIETNCNDNGTRDSVAPIDEQLDYMADIESFVSKAAGTITAKSEPEQRRIQVKKQHLLGAKREKKGEQRINEMKVLQDGLATSIPPSNIGYKMLQKMGYSTGQALGRESQGSIAPVKIDLKRDRTGLGRAEELREEKKLKEAEQEADMLRRKNHELELRQEYKDRRRVQWELRRISENYSRAKAVLAQLESTHEGVGESQEQLTPYPGKEDRAIEDAECEAVSNTEVADIHQEIHLEDLQLLLQRLRQCHSYCLYCGMKYDSLEQLEELCPGLDEECH